MKGFVYPSVLDLFDGVSKRVKSVIGEPRNPILSAVTILTREKITSDYLSLRFANQRLPSFGLNLQPYRQVLNQFFANSVENQISDTTAILLVSELLQEENTTASLSGNARMKLAETIFKNWEEAIFSNIAIGESSELYEKFSNLLAKGNQSTRGSGILKLLKEGDIRSLSELETVFGKKILIYAISEMEPLVFKLLLSLSEHIPIEFHLINPITNFIQDNMAYATLPDGFVLKQIHQAGVSVQTIDGEDSRPEIRFFRAREKYREIEYVARDILKTIEENQDNAAFNLTSIKVCLPVVDEEYFSKIKGIFNRLGISVALTSDVSWKTSAWYSAFRALVDLIDSEYKSSEVFRLLHNPCFSPVFLYERPYTRVWKNLAVAANITGWLDAEHKKRMHIREDKYLTWEDGLTRIIEVLTGVAVEPILPPDGEDEANKFVTSVSSLLHDLETFSKEDLTAAEKIRFLRIMTDTYLYDGGDEGEQKDIDSLRAKMHIHEMLEKAENSLMEFESLMGQPYKGNIKLLVHSLEQNIAIGSPGILKKGVVVGTLKDSTDPVFDYIYCLGLSENVLPDYSGGKNTDNPSLSRMKSEQSAFVSRIYFYHLLKQNAKEIAFSYVNLDTVKDRPLFPSSEYKILLDEYHSKVENIPLFADEEVDVDRSHQLLWENSVLRMHYLQFEENREGRKSQLPSWQQDENNQVQNPYKNIQNNENYKNVFHYLFRDKTRALQVSQEEELLTIPISRLARFMTCPASWFFQHTLGMEEEEELQEETQSIQPIERSKMSRSAIAHFICGRDFHVEEFFNESGKRAGIIPTGVPGLAEKELWGDALHKLQSSVMQLMEENNLTWKKNGLQFGQQAYDYKGDLLIFPGPSRGGNLFSGLIDFVFDSPDGIYFCNLSTSTVLRPADVLTIWIVVYVFNHSPELATILSSLGLAGEVKPAILRYKFKEGKLDFIKTSFPSDAVGEDILDQYIQWFLSEYYPFAPVIPIGENSSCKYCIVSGVCFAHTQEKFEMDTSKLREFILTLGKKSSEKGKTDA